jgi:hypothetical protein
MFRKQKQCQERHITFDVNLVEANAMHIRKGGCYILEVPNYLPTQELDKVIKSLKETTGAKWIVIQGGSTVRKVEYV